METEDGLSGNLDLSIIHLPYSMQSKDMKASSEHDVLT